MKNYFGIDIEKKREALLKSKAAHEITESIIKKADSVLDMNYSPIKMSEYMLYYETGDRITFEEIYDERRNNCAVISAALWLTEDEKYIKPLIDAIFVICDEYTWCLPAHAGMDNNPTPDEIVSRIDLANAETARAMTEIAVLNGDKLPRYVNERIEYELKRRIIEGLKRECGWEKSTSNWASVCAGSSASVLLHFGSEQEIIALMPKLYKAIDNFLIGYDDDGCCKEGFGYWSYGFGHFLYFAQLAYTFSGGEKNYFENEKIKKIAMFPQKMRMGKSNTYCMADSRQGFFADIKNLSLLRRIYGKEILYPELSLSSQKDRVYSVMGLLWFDTDYKADKWPFGTEYFENSQIYIRRTENYSFAAKGGTNGEPHNHNDIGSFMIVDKNDNVPIADIGRGEYTRDSFDLDIRYTIFINGSQGHSVPIVNDKFQIAGAEYRASNVKKDDNSFSLDIEGAYEKGLIKRINRKFEFFESTVTMTDLFEYSDETESVCERLISFIKPEICDEFVALGSTKIFFEKDKFSASVGSEIYNTGLEDKGKKMVYYIDFKHCKGLPESFGIKIKMGD